MAVFLHDVLQSRHAILRNYPVVGHLRYLIERLGPELRQYIVASDTEERPFDRVQRSWVYQVSKGQNSYQGFGTAAPIETTPDYLVIRHSPTPLSAAHPEAHDGTHPPLTPAAKTLGGPRGRDHAVRPPSLIAISAMSFGSLSSAAIKALNAGAAEAGAWHNTGEGGIAPHHLQGGDLIWQLGTGYFGARDADGRFSMARLVEQCEAAPVRAIEVKLSQGAKPGLGGVLPAAKVTPEIAAIRGVPLGVDVISPPSHREFHDPDSMLDFVEAIADATGLPVGIKTAVGQTAWFEELADLMAAGDRGVDFIAIDGGEGGTGAAPVVFADHVSVPFLTGFPRIYRIFAERGIEDDVFWIGAGKLGFPDRALLGLGLGLDMVYVAREAMLSLGCIQAQECHTGHCPVGIATQDPRKVRGLVPSDKSVRVAGYLRSLDAEIVRLAHACGVAHPSLINTEHFELLDGHHDSTIATQAFRYDPAWLERRTSRMRDRVGIGNLA